MKNNPSLIAARIAEDIGKEAINTARSSLFPKIKGILVIQKNKILEELLVLKEKVQLKLTFHIL